MENKNYGEIFCQATEILAQHLIEQISFDRTILCTIVDDSEKNIGKYRVSNTDMTFDAYTSDTNYKIHDNVYVSIPGGDWNEQKLIVSKKANDSETMVEYINPYDRFINITNNIIPTNNLTAGLVANDINKKQILLWSYNSNEDSTLKSGGEVYTGYTRLALSGSFQTLLKSFDVRFGDYGLNLVIKTAAADSDKTAVKVCNLNCADMTGNPYNYQGFFPQAKIFDISNINQVIEMELWFYQKAGSFKNAQGVAIPYENMSSNVLVKDINVALGYDTQSFDKDTLILYTQDLTDYDVKEDDEKNHKKLEVRWIHKFDENGKIKVVELNDGIDYNLTFYRHSLGEPSHSVWSGVDWAVLSSQTVVEGEVSYECADAARDPSYNSVWLKPDYNKAQERIKAILTYNNDQEVLFSYILTINNANEVVSQETVNALSALNINCEDNSNGNYFLYRLDGRILDPAYSQIKRAFKLYFNTYGDTSGSLTEAESIEWIIPANNTMINLYPDQGQELKDDGFYHVKIENNNDSDIFNLYYTINSSHRQQNNNNTIKCVIVRNQIEYTAIKELTFGTAGTAGTDYTFVLDFADNRYNALTIGENKSIKVEATLYDYTGKKLDISDRTIEWSLTYSNYVSFTDGTKSNKKDLQFSKTITEVPEDNYTILKAVLTDWGDFDLEAYLPIPIRLNKDYQFISGTTTIVYNSLGNLDIDTFQNPYVIYKNDGTESIKGDWSIRSGAEEDNKKDPYIPTLNITNNNETILKPINIYVEDTMTQLCVTGSDKDIKVWSQPIYAYQNKYPTSIINDWNGELTIDNDKNSILAAKIVAGRKDNTDNTFTGVMMGDWRGTGDIDTEAEITEYTGIYGFRNGAATFGFKDDGTAFIGEAGSGRLIFDGSKSTISSNLMVDNKRKGGMLLDFDDGLIELVQSSNSEENKVVIAAGVDVDYPIYVGKEKKFKVNWDGKITATDGDFKGKVTAESGTIGAWSVLSQATEYTFGEGLENRPDYFDKIPWPPPSDWPPDLNYPMDENNQVIDMSGMLYAKNFYLLPDGRLRIGSINNPKFEVQPDGTLISKGGLISFTDGDKTIFEANNDGFNLANGSFIYNKDEDTLRLKGVTIQWSGDDAANPPEIGNIDGLENYLDQLDGRIQTYSQTNDPSETWAKNDYQSHIGDLWINPDDGITQRWNGSSWEVVTDSELEKLAESKAQIFTVTPTPPYYVGDLWVQGSTGDIKHCITSRSENEEYNVNDWVISSKYTDDTALNNFISGEYADELEAINNQIDKKAETWYQSEDPSLAWTTTDLKNLHVGDLWYNTSENKSYIYGSDYKWQESDVPEKVYDAIDGKAQIFTSQPVPPYYVGDLWVQGSTGDILHCKQDSTTEVYNANDWVISSKYTDDTKLNDFLENEFKNVKQIGQHLADAFGYQTEVGEDYIFSPAISTGYLDIIGKNQSRVIIDPNEMDPDNIDNDIFLINNGEKNTLRIDKDGNAEFTGTITSNSKITGATIEGGSITIKDQETNDTLFQVKEDGTATFKGNIIMTGGSIKWESIEDPPTIPDQITLPDYIKLTGITKTSIQSPTIYGGEIYASTFYAVEGNKNTYATMESDGFKIFKSSTTSTIPKIQLISEGDGAINYLHLGAGSGATGEWINDKKFIIEQTADYAKLYYKLKEKEYGFLFDSKGVKMLGGGEFNVGTQAYAVFG